MQITYFSSNQLLTLLACMLVCSASTAWSASAQVEDKPAAAPHKVSPYAVAMQRQREEAARNANNTKHVTPSNSAVGRPPKPAGRSRRH